MPGNFNAEMPNFGPSLGLDLYSVPAKFGQLFGQNRMSTCDLRLFGFDFSTSTFQLYNPRSRLTNPRFRVFDFEFSIFRLRLFDFEFSTSTFRLRLFDFESVLTNHCFKRLLCLYILFGMVCRRAAFKLAFSPSRVPVTEAHIFGLSTVFRVVFDSV